MFFFWDTTFLAHLQNRRIATKGISRRRKKFQETNDGNCDHPNFKTSALKKGRHMQTTKFPHIEAHWSLQTRLQSIWVTWVSTMQIHPMSNALSYLNCMSTWRLNPNVMYLSPTMTAPSRANVTSTSGRRKSPPFSRVEKHWHTTGIFPGCPSASGLWTTDTVLAEASRQ